MFFLAPVAALSAPAPAPKPLPFVFQASPAYGEPDRFEDRPFDRYEFRGKDGKPATHEGRWFYRQWHYRKDSGQEKPSAYQVYRNEENALRAAGAELLYGAGKPNPEVIFARAVVGGKTLWIRMDPGSDFFTLWVVQEEPMKQEFSADFLTGALEKQGFAALDVHFATDSDRILPESAPLLDQAAGVLKAHPDWRISVEGHTDATGEAAHNKDLSGRRAKAVVQALAERGVPAAGLAAAGFGPERPVADNRTEEGRARNRRVELVKR